MQLNVVAMAGCITPVPSHSASSSLINSISEIAYLEFVLSLVWSSFVLICMSIPLSRVHALSSHFGVSTKIHGAYSPNTFQIVLSI